MSRRVAIAAGSRTPIGKAGRAYRGIHPVDLLAHTFRATIGKTTVDAAEVDRVVVGCTHQAGDQAFNIGRNGWLSAGLPELVPALTLDAQCCSGQEAANLAYGMVASGQADTVVVGGVDSQSRVASGSTYGPGLGDPYPPSLERLWSMPHQGLAAERMAVKYGVSRRSADEYGVASHLRAARAWDTGAFQGEIVTVPEAGGEPLSVDEGVRRDSSLERAAALPPVYGADGIVTAANASQLSDGAASLLIASEAACMRLGLQPLAWIRSTASAGADPETMMEGPLHATERVLRRTGLTIGDLDIVEIHEAYAIPVLVWMEHWGVSHDMVNIHGGAIGLGHPFGASGVRQLLHLANILHNRGSGIGLQTMCGGGGLGVATILDAA